MISDNSHIVKKSHVFQRRLGKKFKKMVWRKKCVWEWFCKISILCTVHCVISSLTLFWQKFRESNGFPKELIGIFFSVRGVRENFSSFHTVICKNKQNLLSHKKYFVKTINTMIYLGKRGKRWFHGIFPKTRDSPILKFRIVAKCVHSTVWKNEKFSLTKRIFRQINSLVIFFS